MRAKGPIETLFEMPRHLPEPEIPLHSAERFLDKLSESLLYM